MLSTIADIIGIVSFLLTLVLLVRSEAIRKEIENQRIDYKNERKSIRKNLIALRSNVIDDNILNSKVVSDIRTELYSYQQKFQHLLSLNDKNHMKVTLKILETVPDEINKYELCRELDYFVARFERKEI